MTYIEEKHIGYSIKKQNGEINLNKFKNTIDWSLDLIKLKEEYYKVFRNKSFSFYNKNKEYTQVLINVTFSYSYKEFNPFGKNAFVKAGYCYSDLQFVDGICIKDGELIGIQTNIEIDKPVDDKILGDYFSCVDEVKKLKGGQVEYTGNKIYKKVKEPKVLMTKGDLRKYLYKNGFFLESKKYVRYKRSSGSSRVGKCLFVIEPLKKRMDKWDKCGLQIKEGDNIDLAAYESYISLPLSSIIDTIRIPLDSILIVDDYTSTFLDSAIAVEEENNRLVAREKDVIISNSIFDGESLLDSSFFETYQDKGMLLLRNRFFKTCAFNTNISKFFKDNNITNVNQLNGYTRAKDISQIKLITTPSSIKYLKFGTLCDWLDNVDDIFGIVKYEKETKFFNGKMVQCHYQLINTLDFTKEEIEDFLRDSLKYISDVRNDPTVMRYHIGYEIIQEEDEEYAPYKNKNEVVFKLIGLNDKFPKTKIYKEFRDTLIKGYIKNLKRGHILVEGNYSTLFGNGHELLLQSIGLFNGESILPEKGIYSKRFSNGEKILGVRSPHICAGNVFLAENTYCEQIDKYFNLTKEIICVNSINDNLLQRLNGADYDSDTILITNDKTLVKVAERSNGKFKVPTNLVNAKKTERVYVDSHKADLDIKTSVNKIGEIVNLSQQLNSIYWDKKNGKNHIDDKDIYLDVCKLAVLSNIEIDKAKKEFTIDSGKELTILRDKYRIGDNGKSLKPMFFKTITCENGYKLPKNTKYKYFKTPMDYLQKGINSFNFRLGRKYKEETIPFMAIVKEKSKQNRSGYYCNTRDKIINLMIEAKKCISKLYIDYDKMDDREKRDVKQSVFEVKQDYLQIVDQMSENEYLMYLVLRELDNKKYRSIHNIMFEILFSRPTQPFLKMINKNRECMTELVENYHGEITYFGRNYSKVNTKIYKKCPNSYTESFLVKNTKYENC